MKDAHISYNPFLLKTEVLVNGKQLPKNSWFNGLDEKRLQEWVDELPQKLKDEENDTRFKITFRGLPLDFEDLQTVMANQKVISIDELVFEEPTSSEGEDRRQEKIKKVFEKIQKEDCPFESLRSDKVKDAFNSALSNDFNVYVIATMSAGKSTLINSLLGQKLMPSKQEACTAIITHIKDDDSMAGQPFKARVYKKNGSHDTIGELDYKTMDRLNSDPDVDEIKAIGEIPFVSSKDTSLILIDTPGPNNARNMDHRRVNQKVLDNRAMPLVLYIMTGEFGNDSDNQLLGRVASAMKAGQSRQLRDRFLFVVNKLDGRTKQDGDINQFLDDVRKYLHDMGIDDPNIFPVGALPALDIRRMQNCPDDLDEDELDAAEMVIKKLNRSLHLDELATLAPSVRREVDKQLEIARKTWLAAGNKDNKNNPSEALVHTGIPSVEAAIRQYVEKYAYTARIKNLVDTFMRELNEKDEETRLQCEMTKSIERENQIKEDLRQVQEIVNSGQRVRDTENSISQTVREAKDKATQEAEDILASCREKILDKINSGGGAKLEMDEVDHEVRMLDRFVKSLEEDLRDRMETMIDRNLVKTCNNLTEDYQKKLADFGTQMPNFKVENLVLGAINPGDISRDAIRSIEQTEQREDGREWVENTNKKWWKPWTWPQENGYWRKTYKDVKIVPLDVLVQTYFSPIQVQIGVCGEEVMNYVIEQGENTANYFRQLFRQLDEKLNERLKDLEQYKVDRSKVEQQKAALEARLAWLESIKAEINEILAV